MSHRVVSRFAPPKAHIVGRLTGKYTSLSKLPSSVKASQPPPAVDRAPIAPLFVYCAAVRDARSRAEWSRKCAVPPGGLLSAS